jgi:flagellar motor switch/type III secretory pathway protein FliN
MILLTTTTLPIVESLVEDQHFNLHWILLFNKSSKLAKFITNTNGIPNNVKIEFGDARGNLKSLVQFGHIDSLPINQNAIDLL